MTLDNFPTTRPAFTANFARSQQMPPQVTFSRASLLRVLLFHLLVLSLVLIKFLYLITTPLGLAGRMASARGC